MTVEFQLTQQEFFGSQVLHFRPKAALRWTLLALGGAFGAVMVYYFWLIAHQRVLPRGWWFLPVGLAYGASLYYFILPWRVGKIFRANPGLAAATKLSFNEDGMSFASARGDLRLPWKSFSKWKINSRLVLLYHSGSHFHTIPLRSFRSPEDAQSLVALMAKNLGPAQD